MKGGRKPKPAHIKLLEGMREDRVNRMEPTPSDGEVRPPRELSEGARRYWDWVAADLVGRKVVTQWDSEVLCRWSEWCARYEELSNEIRQTGYLVDGRMEGSVVKSPAWQLLRDASTQIDRLGSVLGLNPADRSRLAIEDTGPTSGAERLLS